MIEINLLPEESRRAQKTAFNLPQGSLKRIIKFCALALLLPNMLIPVLVFARGIMLKQDNNSLDNIAPQRKQIDRIREETAKHKALEKLFSGLYSSRMGIAPKLSALSDSLPQGLWLDELVFSGGNWEIRGKCFSASSSEMAQVGQFLSAIKSAKEPSRAFGSLELGSVQRKKLGPTEIAEFAISSKKPKIEPKADPKAKKKEAGKKSKVK